MAKKKSKNEPYTVIFDYKDTKSLYEKPAVLPAAAVWNFDEFVMAYIAAGIEALLNGATAWDPETRKRLKKIQKLAQEFIDHKDDVTYDLSAIAHKVFKLINKVGLCQMWD